MDVFSKVACQFGTQDLLSAELMRQCGIPPAELYAGQAQITALATAAQSAAQRDFILLPFCHTVEAKAMGAEVRPADETAGPRPGRCTLTDPEAISVVSIAADGDAARLLGACAAFVREGKEVIYQLSGPISILSCLMDLSTLFKCWRKTPERVQVCLSTLQAMLLDYARALCDTGIHCISYADPAGSPDILGPKYGALLTEQFTLPFLKQLVLLCETRCTLLICPLTAAALARGNHLRTVTPDRGELAVCCIKRAGAATRKTIALY